MKDYYKILRLPSSASSDEIKRSYRRLAMVYHPDRSNNPNAHEFFSEINEAYEILSDQNLKSQYDNLVNSQGDFFVEAQTFSENFDNRRNANRTARVYRATRKTKDIVTPYIVKLYKGFAYLSVILMSLLLIDFVIPDVKYNEILKEKKFGDGNTMEYVLKTSTRTIVIEQDDYVKFKEGDEFIYNQSTIFRFDRSLEKVIGDVNTTFDLPGNFFKYFNLFAIVVLAFAILTIRAQKEQDILQFGTANFYLSMIIIISAVVVY